MTSREVSLILTSNDNSNGMLVFLRGGAGVGPRVFLLRLVERQSVLKFPISFGVYSPAVFVASVRARHNNRLKPPIAFHFASFNLFLVLRALC